MENGKLMTIEVAYALPETQRVVRVEVPKGSIIAEVLQDSRIRSAFPGLAWEKMPVGVFGERRSRDHMLEPGDRLELYRPLEGDPKAIRRRRAGKVRPRP